MATVARPAPSTIETGGCEDAAGVLGELFHSHGKTVYGLCSVLLRDAHEAEDAAQQAFVSAYESLQAGVAPSKPDAWLLTIARNECLDRLRKRTRHPVSQLDRELASEGVEEIVARNAMFAAACAVLDELPARQRDAILLHELGGLSYAEIAEMLDLSIPAVESLLFRGRQTLQHRAGALRLLAGAIVLPVAFQEGIAKAIPGFVVARSPEAAAIQAASAGAAGGSATAGGGGAAGLVSLKLASLPLVAKLAVAAVLVAGTTSTIVHGVTSRPDVTPATGARRVQSAPILAEAFGTAVSAPASGTAIELPATEQAQEAEATAPTGAPDASLGTSVAQTGPSRENRPPDSGMPSQDASSGGDETAPARESPFPPEQEGEEEVVSPPALDAETPPPGLPDEGIAANAPSSDPGPTNPPDPNGGGGPAGDPPTGGDTGAGSGSGDPPVGAGDPPVGAGDPPVGDGDPPGGGSGDPPGGGSGDPAGSGSENPPGGGAGDTGGGEDSGGDDDGDPGAGDGDEDGDGDGSGGHHGHGKGHGKGHGNGHGKHDGRGDGD